MSHPITVVMITLNEEHNIVSALENIIGWAGEVLILDSYSKDSTVDIALSYGAKVFQKKFNGFGSQWNFALSSLPITYPWTMKLDPDEILSDELKIEIERNIHSGYSTQQRAFSFDRRLWFLSTPLNIKQEVLRIWPTGTCRFSEVEVNEHPLVDCDVIKLSGYLEHHDSPDLEHWVAKQNQYTTMEAAMFFENKSLSVAPKLFGGSLERRMWVKRNFFRIPLRYNLLFFYNFVFQGAFLSGWAGFVWARYRTEVMRLIEYKYREMRARNSRYSLKSFGPGQPDKRVKQF